MTQTPGRDSENIPVAQGCPGSQLPPQALGLKGGWVGSLWFFLSPQPCYPGKAAERLHTRDVLSPTGPEGRACVDGAGLLKAPQLMCP